MQWLRSLIFTTFMFAYLTGFAVVYVTVTPFLPFKGRSAMGRSLGRVILGALKLICGLGYSVEGRENLPAGQHIILMKHSSSWETIAQLLLFPPLVWVMKREVMWIPFVGWGCNLARCIAIDRKAGASAVNQVLAPSNGCKWAPGS
jgi:1-acyl-sn-glycerol-3-phosphate acyltransferase